MAGGRLWTKEEDEYLLDRIGKASVKAIAYKLDRTEMSIKMRMYKLGVRTSGWQPEHTPQTSYRS